MKNRKVSSERETSSRSPQGWLMRLKIFLQKTRFGRRHRFVQETEEMEEEVSGNPFLPKLRNIIEQVDRKSVV